MPAAAKSRRGTTFRAAMIRSLPAPQCTARGPGTATTAVGLGSNRQGRNPTETAGRTGMDGTSLRIDLYVFSTPRRRGFAQSRADRPAAVKSAYRRKLRATVDGPDVRTAGGQSPRGEG